MFNRISSYINISTALLIVGVVFFIFVVKLHLVVLKTESQLAHENERASYLHHTLDSLEIYAKKGNDNKRIVAEQLIRDSSIPIKKQFQKPLSVKAGDSVTTAAIVTHPVKPDSVRVTFNFSGNYEKPIQVNRLFSIEKIELMLALSRYDSLYEYTPYLGLTEWKLVFKQRRIGSSTDIISVFRIGNATVENNRTILCEFVEEIHDYSFTKSARVIKFKGLISASGIVGDLSWIDNTFGRLTPIRIPLTVLRY